MSMKITYLGHAALLVEHAGRTLVMDPWLEEPNYLNSWWHYPPLKLKTDNVFPVTWTWCSHDHPDHLHPPTLRRIPKDTEFLVPQYKSKSVETHLKELGFENQTPLVFGDSLDLGDGLTVRCLRTDLIWEDAALIVSDGETTLFNMNDCKLGQGLLEQIGREHRIDIAFLPFSGAIHFPTCYDYSDDVKRKLCAKRRRGHLEAFVERAVWLQAKRAVPFAGNFCLPAPEQQWMNEINNINTPDEAAALLAEQHPEIEGVQMNPGDTWTAQDGLQRLEPAPDFSKRLEHIQEIGRARAEEIAAIRASEPPARPSLPQDFRSFFEDIARRQPDIIGLIDATVCWQVEGDHGGTWTTAFRPSGLDVRDGDDGTWNLKITVDDHILQQGIDGTACWDEVFISFRLKLAENPEFFNEPFFAMLYNSGDLFLEDYLERRRGEAETTAP
ncbi:MAG: MBL fold metallo-hydrolase [Planctomycetota bacterium]